MLTFVPEAVSEIAIPSLQLTLQGGWLLGCLVMAAALIVSQCIVAVYEAGHPDSGAEDAAKKLRNVADKLEIAAKDIEAAAMQNEKAAKANAEAARQNHQHDQAEIEALEILHSNDQVLNLLGSQKLQVQERIQARQGNQVTRKSSTAAAASEKAKQASEDAKKKVAEAKKETESSTDSSFFGTLRQVSNKMPMVGAALLFTLVGGLGAGLIKFSIGS